MKIDRGFAAALISTMLLSIGSVSIAAQESYALRAVGTFQGQLQSSEVERPFFEGLSAATDGLFQPQFKTADEVALKGFDALRLLKLGVFDVMEIQVGYVSGDDPFLLGLDLPGVAPDLETERKVVDAFRDDFSHRMLERHGALTLALWPFPGQVFFCKGDMKGLADLKGKKIRSFTPGMGKLIEHLGGTPVSLAFSEVYQSLQRGVIDCGITATLSGNTSKWYEVTDYIYPLSIGWGVQAHVVSKTYFDKLSLKAQTVLVEQFRSLEAAMWDLAFKTFDDGVNCNTGAADCKYGAKAAMTLVPVLPEDKATLREAARTVILPDWSKDCAATRPDCAAAWNGSVGKVVGLSVAAD